MSDQRKDGGPAFPTEYNELGEVVDPSPGMTLRDFFAANIMAGMSANPNCRPTVPDVEGMAEEAYKRADAAIKVRGQ